VTRYFNDGWSTLFETNAAGTLGKSYVLGPRIDEILQSAGQNYLYDGLGSVTGLANSSGAKSATYGYDVFGALRFKSGTAANANNYLFTGRELDPESALYNYRNRYYNPSVGRFLTKDPIGLEGGVNEYLYAMADPVNNIDPNGLLRLPKRVRNAVLGVLVGIASTVGIVHEGKVQGPKPRPKEKEVITAPLTPVKEEKKPKGKKGKDNKNQCDIGYVLPPLPGSAETKGIPIDIVFVN